MTANKPPAVLTAGAPSLTWKQEHALIKQLLAPHFPLSRATSGVTFAGAAKGVAVEDLAALAKSRWEALQARAASTSALPWDDTGPVIGVHYVHLSRCMPAQDRISFERGCDKMVYSTLRGGMNWNDATGSWSLAHDGGRAIMPPHKVKSGVLGPAGMVMVTDGNHSAVASIMAGAQTVPLLIEEDLSALPMEAFLTEARRRGWVYLKDLGGRVERSTLSTYGGLKDDPFRYLATQVAAKRSVGGAFLDYTDPAQSAWIKIERGPNDPVDIPSSVLSADFIEFKLADILYRAAERDERVAALKTTPLDDSTRDRTLALVKQVLAEAVLRGELNPVAERIVLT